MRDGKVVAIIGDAPAGARPGEGRFEKPWRPYPGLFFWSADDAAVGALVRLLTIAWAGPQGAFLGATEAAAPDRTCPAHGLPYRAPPARAGRAGPVLGSGARAARLVRLNPPRSLPQASFLRATEQLPDRCPRDGLWCTSYAQVAILDRW
jgi:hypothetical protein